jgi:hypothetical protein
MYSGVTIDVISDIVGIGVSSPEPSLLASILYPTVDKREFLTLLHMHIFVTNSAVLLFIAAIV